MSILLLIALAASFLRFLLKLTRAASSHRTKGPRLEAITVGAAVNFFDTLGIGSFAPTLTWLKLRSGLPDHVMLGTMMVGLTIPAVLEAVIFLDLLGIRTDPVLLTAYSLSLWAGGVVGQRLMLRSRTWIVQATVAVALLVAAMFSTLANLHLMPVGGTAQSLPLSFVAIAAIVSFMLGVLLNFGVGNDAPSLVMFSLMGLDPQLAFPIIATGSALTAVSISSRHVEAHVPDLRIAVSFIIGGVPGVLIAALIVKHLSVDWLRWMISVVVLCSAITMIRASSKAYRNTGLRSRPAEI